jgi:nucleoside-diphosphate-sugar epimerase
MRPVAALLTGVGYIGAALIRRLVERSERIVALENFYSTSREAVASVLPECVQLVEGDVADPQAVAQAFQKAAAKSQEPITVYHLAAQPSAAAAVREPELTERSNLTGARVLLEAARDRGARVVFGVSFRVYGDDLIGPTVDEETPYGRVGDLSHLSKVYVEQLARMLECSFVSVRLGVTYGRGPIMKTTPAFMTVPNLFCQRAIGGEVLQVLEDRPLAFVHVEDAVEALLLAAADTRATWQVVNAAPEVATIGQLARTVQRLVQSRGGWVRVQGATSSEATFGVRSRLDAMGFQARWTLASGLPDVLDFFAAQ